MANLVKARGLRTFANELILEDGYLSEANNCNIDETGVIQNRRGFNDYGDAILDLNSTIDQVLEYKDRLLRHYDGNLQYGNGSGTFSTFDGEYLPLEEGLRIKSQESKGNLFFTTSSGIKKISARNASQFTTSSGYITDAGIPRAIDLNAKLFPTIGGFLPPQSKCAYRIIWGIRDANNNLLLGAPSERFVLSNTSQDSSEPEAFTVTFSSTSETDLEGNYILFSSSTTNYVLWWSNAANNTEPQTSETLARTYIEVDIDGFGSNTTQILNSTANAIANLATFDVTIVGSVITATSTEEGTDVLDAAAATEAGYVPANLSVATISQGTTVSGTDANSVINFTIPSEITDTAYFYQVYRTGNITATSGLTLNDIDPGDEMNLVFEANVTSAEIASRTVQLTDITTEAFRASGAFLYTNPNSGQGILQANNRPPIAKDIEYFRNSMFFSNTKTKHRLTIDALSTTGFTSGVSSLVIGNSTSSREYIFVGEEEIVEVTCDTVANTTADSYIVMNTANDDRSYYLWFDKGGGTDPQVAGKISIRVNLNGLTTDTEVSQACTDAINLTGDFDATDSAGTFFYSTIKNGAVTDPSFGTPAPGGSWALSVTQQGQGEDTASQEILLSNDTSVGQALDEQTRSLVKVINADTNSPVVAYYLSGTDDVPGQFILESKSLVDDPFFVSVTDPNIQSKFNPELPLTESITAITSGATTQIESAGHGLSTGDNVYIYDTDSTPQILGSYEVTVVDANNFTIPFATTVDGTVGSYFITSVQSDNEEKANRLYFSKTDLPEAVPLLNYIDVGTEDEPIERIIALRDNLFVLKTDGIYIVTGSSAPNFGSRLLDSSVSLTAPDSAVVLNNKIYALTDDGVVSITEAGAEVLSRPIENLILDVTNSDVDFRLTSFGVAYESDRAYILFVPTDSNSTVADQAYRYNTITGTWTRWTVDATCGKVFEFDDKLYLGEGSRPYLKKERKNRDRTDYSDRNFTASVILNNVFDEQMLLGSVTDVEVGDVLVQMQAVTLSKFRRLTYTLDIDTGLGDTDYNTLNPVTGNDMADTLNNLNAKLVADDSSGTITSRIFTNVISDQYTQFNEMIDELNDVACDTNFKNYDKLTYFTPYEAVIDSVDVTNNNIVVNQVLPLLGGDVEIYKNINMEVEYQPQHFGDQSMMKQVRQGTFMFDQTNFYGGRIAYASDISQNFEFVDFNLDGVGDWGSQLWGEFVWGGEGREVPKRTLIPRAKQRCRFLKVRMEHKNAREKVKLLGISLDPRAVSRRAYR
jgi:hypothetical protein